MIDKSREFECKVYKYIHWLSPTFLKHLLGSSEMKNVLSPLPPLKLGPRQYLWKCFGKIKKKEKKGMLPLLPPLHFPVSLFPILLLPTLLLPLWDSDGCCRVPGFSSKIQFLVFSHLEQSLGQGEKSFLFWLVFDKAKIRFQLTVK